MPNKEAKLVDPLNLDKSLTKPEPRINAFMDNFDVLMSMKSADTTIEEIQRERNDP